MDALAMVLQPLAAIGSDISAAVYKLPPSIKAEMIGAIAAQEPSVKAALSAKRAGITGAAQPGNFGLVAIGGYLEAQTFEKLHHAIMSLDGVEFVIGAGPSCAGLPRTALASEAAGAHARHMASQKPWWKIW